MERDNSVVFAVDPSWIIENLGETCAWVIPCGSYQMELCKLLICLPAQCRWCCDWEGYLPAWYYCTLMPCHAISPRLLNTAEAVFLLICTALSVFTPVYTSTLNVSFFFYESSIWSYVQGMDTAVRFGDGWLLTWLESNLIPSSQVSCEAGISCPRFRLDCGESACR